jgi:hypothetical protein
MATIEERPRAFLWRTAEARGAALRPCWEKRITMEQFIELMSKAAIVFVLAGLSVYAVILLLSVFQVPIIMDLLKSWPAYAYSLPMCGIAAFAIVKLLEFTSDGTLKFSAFSLEFSGPAGPVTLWIVVYLSLVASIRLSRAE